MDAKVTLSFNKEVIEKAKKYAQAHNMSLSRMLELILTNITNNQYASLEDFPISDWVHTIAEGPEVYLTKPKTQSKLKTEFRQRNRK